MKITFPQLGNTCYAAKAVFDGLGIDYVLPPKSNKRCLELGSLYSPEEMCLPFKIMLGGYIESIENGADTVIITGSCGPCRFGEYCELQMNILKKLGYNVNFIVLDKPSSIGKEEFLKRISKISNESRLSINKKLKVVYDAYKIINLMDYIEKEAHKKTGYEVNVGECKKILKTCKKEAFIYSNPENLLKFLKNCKNKIDSVKLSKKNRPLKIAIIGEIYTIIEPFSNFYIEDKLMDYGISTSRHLSPSWWFKDAVLSIFKLNSLDLKINSKEYLPYYIGGHARECIGEAVMSSHSNFDGAIQIFPLGCMPEIVAKSILPKISKDKDFPILSLIVDEMSGETGYITRIEAFIDLLERRENNVLHGC